LVAELRCGPVHLVVAGLRHPLASAVGTAVELQHAAYGGCGDDDAATDPD
jgi:hypothetical protein